MNTKREEQRERLLIAAYELVGDVGVSGLRTRDIADRAGLNLATLHYCFENKDALLAALYNHIVERVREETAAYMANKKTPRQRLIAMSEVRLHLLRENPAALRVWRAFADGMWTSPVVREIMRRHFADRRASLAATIAESRADGTISNLPTGDNELAASLLMSLYDGLMFQWVADPEAFSTDAYARAVLTWLGIADTHSGTGDGEAAQ